MIRLEDDNRTSASLRERPTMLGVAKWVSSCQISSEGYSSKSGSELSFLETNFSFKISLFDISLSGAIPRYHIELAPISANTGAATRPPYPCIRVGVSMVTPIAKIGSSAGISPKKEPILSVGE